MRALLKMKEGAHGDALSEPASDPEATKGGDTTEERTQRRDARRSPRSRADDHGHVGRTPRRR